MTNPIKILRYVIDNERINVTNLEVKIGASRGVLSKALRNETDFGAKYFVKILQTYPSALSLINPSYNVKENNSIEKNIVEDSKGIYSTYINKNLILIIEQKDRIIEKQELIINQLLKFKNNEIN